MPAPASANQPTVPGDHPHESWGGLVIVRPRPLEPVGSAWQGLTLISDAHIGSANFDEPLLREDLARAERAGDRVLVNGDVADAVFPGDKRFRQSEIHPRLWGLDNMADAVVDWAVELFLPYAEVVDVIGVGNHDTHVTKQGHTDLVLRLVVRLNEALKAKGSAHRVAYGGYSFLACYKLHCGRKSADLRVYAHHGWGKGSSLSRSAGDYNALSHVEGVDVVWLGHLHSRLAAHMQRVEPPADGEDRVRLRDVRFVRTGSYLRTLSHQSQESVLRYGRRASYAADAALPPHGCGGARVEARLTPEGRKLLRVTQ